MASIIEKIAKMTGKSVDEVSQYLSKITGGAREIDMGDVKSPAMKRGRPSKTPPASQPVNPNEIELGPIEPITIKKGRPAKSQYIDPNEKNLGKTKNNLEIGDSPSSPVSVNEIDAGDFNAINPNIDDYRLLTTSTGTSAVGGGKVPSVIDNLSEQLNSSLVGRKSTIPIEVEPQVLGKGTSKVTPKASTVMDAEMVDKMAEGPLKEQAIKKFGFIRNPITGAVILGTGAGYALNKLTNNSDASLSSESPSINITPVKINGTPDQDSVASGAKGSDTQKEQGKSLESLGEELKSEQTREPSSDRLSYMDMMQNAQQAASQNRLQAALLRAGMQAGAAIAGPGVKADYTAAEALAEAAGTPVSNVKGLMETEAGAKKLQQLEEDLKDEAKLRDPNSEISKIMTNAAIQVGFIKPGTQASAQILQKMGLNLTSILNAQENARSRADSMKLARENMLFQTTLKRMEKQQDIERQYEEKKKEKVAPLEASRQNLKRNLTEYIELLKKVGTGALYGDEEKRMRTLQTEIATDEAKMADPTSSAMSGEVEKYRKGLPEIGTFVPERESTAISLLERKLADVDNRALSGYVARGIKPDPNLYPDLNKTQSSSQLTTPSVSPVAISDETREKRIKFIMDKGHSREEAIAALKEAGKI